ncbi:hypothetical protein RJ639_013984 [Escallonia herrerae]|uniref:Uncharacterized protein n=1 Tax=Escallonia herrerae TaxID=1293975 RepID=A0AA88VGC8_9ASTE|nr:hypothetical protein RJ639_013984 [Escallonia herrerae]
MAKQFSEHRKYCRIAIGEPEVVDLMKEVPCSFSAASLELLNKYGSRMKRLNGIEQHYSNVTSDPELSTVEVMKLATARYTSFLTQSSGDRFMLTHPFNGNHTALCREVTDDLELALFLLASAEKVANEQFDRAWELLRMCNHLASPTGDPVQRVVYYFAEALQERIKRKTGIVSSDGWECNKRWQSRLVEEIMCLLPSSFAHRQELPFYSATQFSGIQAILESMASAKRIHLVDLGIRSRSHWMILMQALAVRHECPLESLNVTAIGTASRQLVEETGRRLSSFADTLSIPFSFKVVMVSDMQDLSDHLFEVEADEVVGVYCSLSLMNFIARPSHLEALMGVIKTICPILMVVTEVEANTNSPAFVDRFV